LRTIQLIYNQINKNGNYKAVYYDTHGSHDNEGSFLKVIENGEMKLFNLSPEQIDRMYQTINSFMNMMSHYHYKEFENADIDNTLLLSITDDEARFDKSHQRYYNWQNTQSAQSVPKGIDGLLKFFEKINNQQ
jgi:hypothetical protein